MNYLTQDLVFAANSKSNVALLNDIARYSLGIKPIKRVRGKNRYNLAALGRAYLKGSLEKLCIPTSHIPEMFTRVHWEAFDYAVDQLETGEIDHLYVVFLCFEPDEDFSGIAKNPKELSDIAEELGHFTAIGVHDFLKLKLEGFL